MFSVKKDAFLDLHSERAGFTASIHSDSLGLFSDHASVIRQVRMPHAYVRKSILKCVARTQVRVYSKVLKIVSSTRGRTS